MFNSDLVISILVCSWFHYLEKKNKSEILRVFTEVTMGRQPYF